MSTHSRWRNLFRRSALSREVSDELEFHIAERADELIEQGMNESEARQAAARQFGNLTAQCERTRDMDILTWLETFTNDIRYTLRTLRQNKGFTTIAVLTLSLGIGANAALFSVVNAIFFHPLSYPESDRIMTVWETRQEAKDKPQITSAPNFEDWRKRNHAFSHMALFETTRMNVVSENGVKSVLGARASADLFPLLGIAPLLGRTPTIDEEPRGKDHVAVLGYSFWQSQFGSDPQVLGKNIRINGDSYMVIGVMPAEFQFPSPAFAIWTPIGLNETDRGRGSHSFQVVARLKPGVSFTQASVEMDTIGRALALEYPGDNKNRTVLLVPMNDYQISALRPMFSALLGAVAFVLLIAAANLANLLLARGAARQREFALRSAIGASRGRLLRQLLTESGLLAAFGCAGGLLLAHFSMAGLLKVLPGNIRYVPFRNIETLSVDGRVLLFAIVVSSIAGMVFGLAPALQAFKTELTDALKQGSRGSIAGSGRLRQVLIAAEVALALIVMTGAGLLTRSLALMAGVDPGLKPENVLTMTVALPQADFYGPAKRTHFCEQLRSAASGVPGVAVASAVSNLPFTGADAGRSFLIEGQPEPASATDRASGSYSVACPDYFRAMGIPLLKGREFEDRDATGGPNAAIINETMRRRYWQNESPVGRRIKFGSLSDDSPWMTIVGVVGDTRRWGFDTNVRPELFRPYTQAAWPGMSVVVRTTADPTLLGKAVRESVAGIDKEMPVINFSSMETVVYKSVGPRRFPLMVLGAFSVLALILASVGIYGVVSYLVVQRTQEIGVRLALGACRSNILGLVLGRSLPSVGIGLVVGIASSLALGRLLESLLYGIRPTDPMVHASVAAFLGVVALLATMIPARRASRVDPAVALRRD